MSRLGFVRFMQLRQKSKYAVVESVEQLFSNEQMKFRQHPGMVKPRSPEAPPWLYKITHKIIHEQSLSLKQVRLLAEAFETKLYHRLKPLEEDEIQKRLHAAKKKKAVFKAMDNEEFQKSGHLKQLLKQMSGLWQPIDYNATNSFLYLVGRSLQDYTVLYKIFSEVKDRDPNFKPYTLLDFGSGVGTVLWAAYEIWGNSLQEYMCIDSSQHMNSLAEKVIGRAKLKAKGTYFRQYLPSERQTTYDIVTSAYSLLELPDARSRLKTLTHLWEKTERYLILVELGNKAGFQVLNEARDFVLQYLGNKSEPSTTTHIVSPCPHDQHCPKYAAEGLCNFRVFYLPFPLFKATQSRQQYYSYVVFKKGERAEETEEWPRIVLPVLRRSGHVICRMCTNTGALREEVFTKGKHGRNAYRCAYSSEWGDRLPVKLVPHEAKTTETENETSEATEDCQTSRDTIQKTET